MKVKLWGVRGSLPAPLSNFEYRSKLEDILTLAIQRGIHSTEEISPFLNNLPDYLANVIGGDTTCIEFTNNSGQQLIIDCGSGLRRLGYSMLTGEDAYSRERTIHIMMTHTHWDHVVGFPFFIPAYLPQTALHFYSTIDNLEERFTRNQHPEHFPLQFDQMSSSKEFHLLEEGIEKKKQINGFEVSCIQLRHPGGCTGYRVEADGKAIVFATDVEVTGDDILEMQKADSSFFNGADILIMDAQYRLEEAFKKFDWGHTTPSICVNFATAFNIPCLVLTHHEPAYSDFELGNNLKEARQMAMDLGNEKLEIQLAIEGSEIQL